MLASTPMLIFPAASLPLPPSIRPVRPGPTYRSHGAKGLTVMSGVSRGRSIVPFDTSTDRETPATGAMALECRPRVITIGILAAGSASMSKEEAARARDLAPAGKFARLTAIARRWGYGGNGALAVYRTPL